VDAENVERSVSLEFRYSNPSADAARGIMAMVPGVMDAVERWNGQGPPTDVPFTIHWLSAGGGGWAGVHTAGVCVYGDDPAYPIKVMAHELTHSTTGPWPRAFNEAWASIVGMRAAESLGYRESGRTEMAGIINRLDTVDRTRRTLNMMDSDDGPMNHDYKHKVKSRFRCKWHRGCSFLVIAGSSRLRREKLFKSLDDDRLTAQRLNGGF
jgi:hypothetical protein